MFLTVFAYTAVILALLLTNSCEQVSLNKCLNHELSPLASLYAREQCKLSAQDLKKHWESQLHMKMGVAHT